MVDQRTENTTTARPWPPAACPDWCDLPTGAAGHPVAAAYRDRVHHGDVTTLDLSATDPAGADEAGFVIVELEQHYRELEPRVTLMTPGGWLAATLGEAEALAHAILSAVAAGRTGGPVVLAGREGEAR